MKTGRKGMAAVLLAGIILEKWGKMGGVSNGL